MVSPRMGCPLTAFAPELARADKRMKAQILDELEEYKRQMLPFVPGRRAADNCKLGVRTDLSSFHLPKAG